MVHVLVWPWPQCMYVCMHGVAWRVGARANTRTRADRAGAVLYSPYHRTLRKERMTRR
jgi:hypothetical protein